jgi:ubiquinone/menaquinone biosynthesis C-methylase UbiE
VIDALAISEADVRRACPCCSHPLTETFYEVGPVPVHSCLMLDTAAEAMCFPTGMVRLALCNGCGFVTNTAFDPKWSAYSPNYEDQQSFSPTFNSFAGQLAAQLIERHALDGKRAVEIGCSKGDFMALLCEMGGMETVGIDPSAVEGRVAQVSRGSMRFLPEYYGPQHLALPADLICCRHTLEHISDVRAALDLMRRHAGMTPDTVLCIEVPDATRIWKTCAFEDIYYEHCSYFTAGSLAAAVRRAGFAVTDLRREYGGQYLVLEACLDPSRDLRFDIEDTPAETATDVAAFRNRIDPILSDWQERIAAPRARGERVAIWGSGSKCVAFLRTLGLAHAVDAIVDINPHRAGKVAPGLGIAISTPETLVSLDPDLVVVMNPIYLREVSADCRAMGLSARLSAVCATPDGSGCASRREDRGKAQLRDHGRIHQAGRE